jgi:hypothetical protein
LFLLAPKPSLFFLAPKPQFVFSRSQAPVCFFSLPSPRLGASSKLLPFSKN